MKTENAVKKVSYSKMSNKKCPNCGAPLKENKVIKGHTDCYVCFKIKNGKYYAYQYAVIDGVKSQVFDPKTGRPKIRRDFRKEQAENRRKYNWKGGLK